MLSETPLAASRLLRGRTGRRDETSKVFIFGADDDDMTFLVILMSLMVVAFLLLEYQ